MKQIDTYGEPTTYFFENAIVRVYRPEITEDERARRMDAIGAAAANLLKDLGRKENGKKVFN